MVPVDGGCMGRGLGQSLASERVRPASVVILKVCQQNTAQVTLIKDDDVIETFAANRPDNALDIGILPWRSRRGDDLLDRHRPKTIREGLPHMTRRGLAAESEVRCPGKASVIWRASQTCVGFCVTSKWMIVLAHDRGRPERRETESSQLQQRTCRRRPCHPCDWAEPSARLMKGPWPPWKNLPTVAWLTSMPSLSSSPWMRGAPQRIARLILRP